MQHRDPASRAIDLARELATSAPLAALHFAWFAVAETIRSIGHRAGLTMGPVHTYEPSLLLGDLMPFNQAIDAEVLARLRPIGEAVDGAALSDAERLIPTVEEALEVAAAFVADGPRLGEQLSEMLRRG